MKVLVLALFIVAAFCQGKYSDMSDSFTNLLLSISNNGKAYSNFQGKLGNLATNIDSSSATPAKVQSSVFDMLGALESGSK
jgi:hypothetical protein